MEFSRLADTKFPDLETASPYALKNTFDYTRWVPDTKVHLVNVLWGGDYTNVVKFEDDDARDNWFDSIKDSYTLTLKSNARIVPDGSIKLPLPYDVACRYNYLYVDIPLATSKEALIQNESTLGARRWYFFVGDVSYSAPNTTVVYLQPDIWTNFIDGARLTYMMLERGHAPVHASDVDSYLADPIGNNRYLLAPDVNFDDSSVVRDSKYVPVGAGTKYIVIASTVGYKQIQDGTPGTIQSGSAFTGPTYSDTSDWYGYQLQVNGYGFGNGSDYSQLRAPVNMYNRPGDIMPTSLDTYAIPASDTTFLEDCRSKSPAFLRTIKAMFVVSEDMLTLGTELTFLGHTIYFVTGTDRSLDGYALSKDMFHFGTNEGRFAKLYTYPYSRIEVSDNSGRTSEIRIENTSGIGTRLLTSVAFPILDCRVYLTGVNGSGSQSYVWKNLSGAEMDRQVPNGDWGDLLFDLDIPTFALYIDAETNHMLDRYSGAYANARRQALAAYHNTVRSANLGYTNALASSTNAHDNNVRDADTAQTNANASASTTKTNTDNLAGCVRDNVNLTIAANDANVLRGNLASSRIAGWGAERSKSVTEAANSVAYATTKEDNETSIATTKNSGVAQIETGIINGTMAGGNLGAGDPASAMTGLIVGAVAGGIMGYINADAANTNASIVTQANETVTSYNNSANTSTHTANTLYAGKSTGEQTSTATEQNTNNDNCMAGQRDNNYSTNTTNALNLYNTQIANSARTHDTSVTDADSTKTTSDANSTRTREVGVLNAKETLEAAQDTARNTLLDARRGAPVQLTEMTGDGANMYHGQNGIQFRLRTQSDSAIAQTAAQFARYGYALNQVWDVESSGLNLMRHFTYWKAADIWVDVRNAASSEVGDAIQRMFETGVTVWSDPDEIGKVGIYDN